MAHQHPLLLLALRLAGFLVLAVVAYSKPARAVIASNRGLLQSAQDGSLTCAGALLDELVSPNTTLAPLYFSVPSQRGLWVEHVSELLSGDERCAATRSSGSGPLTLTWAQYPSWANGAFNQWVWRLKENAETAGYYGRLLYDGPEAMPQLSEVKSSDVMRSYAQDHNSDAVVYSSDLSGFTPSYLVEQKSVSDFTENVCLNKLNPRGPLHPRTFLMLFHRPDALAALRAATGPSLSAGPPDDWEGLLALLQAHAAAVVASSSTASGNATLPKYGMCVTTHPLCGRLGDVLTAIAASAVQSTGTQQGYVFDMTVAKDLATPLVNGAGWRYAVDMVRQLMQYNAPDYIGNSTSISNATSTNRTIMPGSECHVVSPWFTSGDCLLTLEWDMAILSMAVPELQRAGALGVAPLPGSRAVVSNDGTLQPCSLTTCAVSANHDMLYLTSAGQPSAVLVAAKAAAAVCGTGERARMEAAAVAAAAVTNNSSVVNRAPYSALYDYYVYINYERIALYGLGEVMSRLQLNVVSRITQERQTREASMDAVRRDVITSINSNASTYIDGPTYMSTPWWAALGDLAAVRDASESGSNGSLTAAAKSAFASYLALGFDNAAVGSYFRALWHAVHSPNGAPEIAAPAMVNWFKWGISQVSVSLLPPNGSSTDEATSQLLRVFAFVSEAHTAAAVRSSYELSIDVAQSLSPAPSLPSDSKKSGLSAGGLAGVVISAVAGIVLTALLVAVLVRIRNRRRDLLGRVRAPKAGPDTTLLITDIQSSTSLWEQLPVSVMDASLKLHHTTIRGLLAEHDGYESGTEGDSFILAFADPANAVAFAVATQEALLLLEWPPQLLTHPEAMPVLVDPVGGEAEQRAGVPGSGGGGFGHRSSGSTSRSRSPAVSGSIASRLSEFIASRVRVSAMTSFGGSAAATLPPPPSLPYTPRSGGSVTGFSMFDTGNEPSVIGGTAGCAEGPNSSQPSTPPPPPHPPPPQPTSSRTERVRWGPLTDAITIPAAPALTPVESSEVNSSTQESNAISDSSPTPEATTGTSELPPITATARLDVKAACDSPTWQRGGGINAPVKKALAVTVDPAIRTSMDGSAPASAVSTPAAGSGMLGLAGRWGAALQAVFPTLLQNEAPAGVLNGQALKSPRVLLPSSRLGVVAYRGLRVRMGLHTGLDDAASIAFNKVASAFKYHGALAEAAKAAESTAPGGLVVLSGAAFARLRNTMGASDEHRGRGGGLFASNRRRRGPEAVVIYGGHHVLPEPKKPVLPSKRRASRGVEVDISATEAKPLAPPAPASEESAAEGMALYAAVPASLACRLALSPPLVSERVVQLGTLAAPVGTITVAFMYVVGASTLLSELPGPAARALEQFQRLACGLLGAAGGYLVEGEEGLLLAAFGAPRAGVEWALDCVAGLKKLHWEDELLGHWLCEEVLSVGVAGGGVEGSGDSATSTGSLFPSGNRTLGRSLTRMPSMARLGAMAATQKVQERGLRIKVGLDCGRAYHSLTEASGRLSYRGKVMNRASRVAGKAAAGQVLCTDTVWKGCMKPLLQPCGSISETPDDEDDDDEDEDNMNLGNLVGVSLGKVTLKGVTLPVELIQCMRG